ncbi:P-loop NTPase fold protein [Microcoleus sp. herbarium7]|uniref:KAP family P-loop NTPase fold protein n=1 Tax=Microcoleus sp. herbarium7 TaxID=3055435 RepID=UPI002FD72A4A
MSYNDRPNEEPSLNFELYAKELGKIAVKATTGNEGAFTVGIFGSWGSGKTTLMRCIERKLKNFITEFTPEEFEFHLHNFDATKFKTIWFNPWKYDDTHGIRNALIQTILREMAENSQGAIVKEKCNNLATRYNASECFLHIGEHLVGAALQSQMCGVNPLEIIKALRNLGGRASKNQEENQVNDLELDTDPYLFINSFEAQFREVVKEYVGQNGRLVIFIDDLDRCLPENALTVLESLKLYLDNANCVFFIGLDKRVIEQAVKQRYKDLNVTGKEYIEKMIQLNFFLPEKNSNQVTQVLQNELNELVACPNYPIDARMWRMILAATKGNFRKTKQFVIAWALIRSLAISLKVADANTIPQLAKILLIQMNFPQLYDALPTKSYHLMGNLKKTIDAYSKSKEDGQKEFSQYPECKRFLADNHLCNFLKGNDQDHADYADISDPQDLRKLLQILSQTGR